MLAKRSELLKDMQTLRRCLPRGWEHKFVGRTGLPLEEAYKVLARKGGDPYCIAILADIAWEWVDKANKKLKRLTTDERLLELQRKRLHDYWRGLQPNRNERKSGV